MKLKCSLYTPVCTAPTHSEAPLCPKGFYPSKADKISAQQLLIGYDLPVAMARTLFYLSVQNMPFTRPQLRNILGAVNFAVKTSFRVHGDYLAD
jgi:hypothetical protein